MDPAKEIELDPRDWEYLNEGNLHIILSYHGKDQFFVGKVLQICKSTQKTRSAGDDEVLSEKLSDFVEEEFYQKSSIQKFRCLPVEILISNKQTFLEEIAKTIEPKRPESRRIRQVDKESKVKFQDDLSLTYLKQMASFEGLSLKGTQAFVVEIKPKSPVRQVFSEKDVEWAANELNIQLDKALLSEINKEILSEKGSLATKYSKVQLEKLEKKCVGSKSQYDPREFYQLASTKSSVKSLFENPQNNLRISKFKEAEGSWVKENILSPRNEEEFSALLEILAEILKINFFVLQETITLQRLFLRESSVLEEYHLNLSTQREALLKLLESKEGRSHLRSLLLNWYWRTEAEKRPVDEIILHCFSYLSFLISLTWRDFSILINVVKTDSEALAAHLGKLEFKELSSPEEKSSHSLYRMKIIDTDLKPVEKIKETREAEKNQLKLAIKSLLV